MSIFQGQVLSKLCDGRAPSVLADLVDVTKSAFRKIPLTRPSADVGVSYHQPFHHWDPVAETSTEKSSSAVSSLPTGPTHRTSTACGVVIPSMSVPRDLEMGEDLFPSGEEREDPCGSRTFFDNNYTRSSSTGKECTLNLTLRVRRVASVSTPSPPSLLDLRRVRSLRVLLGVRDLVLLEIRPGDVDSTIGRGRRSSRRSRQRGAPHPNGSQGRTRSRRKGQRRRTAEIGSDTFRR